MIFGFDAHQPISHHTTHDPSPSARRFDCAAYVQDGEGKIHGGLDPCGGEL
jgi:hypothetical protein